MTRKAMPRKIFLQKRLREYAGQCIVPFLKNAGWSSLVARQAHNLKVAGSNPAPATTLKRECFTGCTCCKTLMVLGTSVFQTM